MEEKLQKQITKLQYDLKEKNEAINSLIQQDFKKLEEIKQKLISSIKNSNTFNTKIYTKNLEKAYQQIYENYHQNLAPENIYIN